MKTSKTNDMNGVPLEVGQTVEVWCVWDSENQCSKPSKTLGEIVWYDEGGCMALMYQGEELYMDSFSLKVVDVTE